MLVAHGIQTRRDASASRKKFLVTELDVYERDGKLLTGKDIPLTTLIDEADDQSLILNVLSGWEQLESVDYKNKVLAVMEPPPFEHLNSHKPSDQTFARYELYMDTRQITPGHDGVYLFYTPFFETEAGRLYLRSLPGKVGIWGTCFPPAVMADFITDEICPTCHKRKFLFKKI